LSKKILISAPYMIPVLDRFRAVFEHYGLDLVVPNVEERMEAEDLLEYAGDIDGAITGDDRFNDNVLKAFAPRLKVISKWGTGIDSIDQAAAQKLGVDIRNTPGAFTNPVADSVLAYILAFARQTPWLDKSLKSGGWAKVPGRALRECTLGVIGVGEIGKSVLQRAKAFDMHLIGNDIVEIDSDFIAATDLEMTSLEELLGQSDFVSLNCSLNPSSHHILNAERIRLMKSSAVIINTARGSLIEEQALIEALKDDRLAGAGLDVFEDEPLPKNSPLRTMEQVLLAPHNANSSPEAWEAVHWNTIRNLLSGLDIEHNDLDPKDYPA